MKTTFSEVKLFQVKPDKTDEFEALAERMACEQQKRTGCSGIKYMKRFYVFDDIKDKPRELARVVKCVKYYSHWQFDTLDNYAEATHWFFDSYSKEVFRLLIMPFDINCGYDVF